jgi:plastocyanin
MSKQRNWRRLGLSFVPAIAIAFVLLGLGAASVAANGSAQAATINIEIGDNFFAPTSITANVGDTIVWTHKGQRPHDVTADNGAFFSPRRMMNGQSFSYTVTQAGTFAYQCTVHTGQLGTLIVQAAMPTSVPSTGGGGMSGSSLGTWQQLALLGGTLIVGSTALVALRRRRA